MHARDLFIHFLQKLFGACNYWQVDENHPLQPPPIQHTARENNYITLHYYAKSLSFNSFLKAKMRGIEIDKNYSSLFDYYY